MNNIKAASGTNPPSNPTRPKERKISIRHPLFLNSPFSILHSLRFVLLSLFLPATSISIGQVPGTPYGVLSLDCSTAPATPGNIGLSTTDIKREEPFTASISPVDGAKSYEWVLVSGLEGSSSGSSIEVTAKVKGTYDLSAITVKAVNDCGSSSAVTLGAGFKVPGPGESNIFRGLSSMCPASNKAICTCEAGGTPVWGNYRVSAAQQDAVTAYFEDGNGKYWWVVPFDSSSGTAQAFTWNGSNYAFIAVSEGYAACFD